MKDIAIYGAGGFGREIACLIKKINDHKPTWNLIGFFDDGKITGSENEYGKVLGGLEILNKTQKPLSIVITIANPKTVKNIVENIKSPLIDFPNLISPDVVYLDENNFTIGQGNIIGLGCYLSCNASIGNFNILNGVVIVGHDTKIGDYNTIMTSVNISGNVTIGNGNFLGVNSVILQQIKIGSDTVVGANSLIIMKTKDGNTYIGNPATIFNY